MHTCNCLYPCGEHRDSCLFPGDLSVTCLNLMETQTILSYAQYILQCKWIKDNKGALCPSLVKSETGGAGQPDSHTQTQTCRSIFKFHTSHCVLCLQQYGHPCLICTDYPALRCFTSMWRQRIISLKSICSTQAALWRCFTLPPLWPDGCSQL